MEKRPVNVPEPDALRIQLDRTFREIHALIHLMREKTLFPFTDGVINYTEAAGPCAFEVTQQFDRPAEYLQTLLDLIRIIHEPYPPGTLLLNANLGFVLEEIPVLPFRIGYLSVTSLPGETTAELHVRAVAPKLAELGYDMADAYASF